MAPQGNLFLQQLAVNNGEKLVIYCNNGEKIVLPTPYFKGDITAIKIDECAYLEALESCKHNLIGRLILPKESKPIKSAELYYKLSTVWSFKQ